MVASNRSLARTLFPFQGREFQPAKMPSWSKISDRYFHNAFLPNIIPNLPFVFPLVKNTG
jgi:hypothetical protein